MRGDDEQTGHLFSYHSPEQRVPADHPLRAIQRMTDEALGTLSPTLDRLYADTGRPSFPPEPLLRALLVRALDTVRSKRLLMEQLQYNLLFRWFVRLSTDDPVRHPTTFTKNRDRLLTGDVAARFFDAVVAQARAAVAGRSPRFFRTAGAGRPSGDIFGCDPRERRPTAVEALTEYPVIDGNPSAVPFIRVRCPRAWLVAGTTVLGERTVALSPKDRVTSQTTCRISEADAAQ